MQGFNWEDPFGIDQSNAQPTLMGLGKTQPPVNLRHIRERQKDLLPFLHVLRRVILPDIRHMQRDLVHGGSLTLATRKCDVAVTVLHRQKNAPSVVQRFGPITITDIGITLPASFKERIPVLSPLFPEQYVVEPEDHRSIQALSEARQQMGLVQREGIGLGAKVPTVIVVYPKVLGIAARWIGKYDRSILSDLSFYELAAETNIRSGRQFKYDPKPKQYAN